MEQEFAAFLDSPVQWVFNRSRIQGADPNGGQYLCISVSGAWDYVDRPKEELRELFAAEMARLFPKAAEARIERSLVVKQPQATFRPLPGASALRPTQVTPIPNLFLAGDFTDTGWPSTMEGGRPERRARRARAGVAPMSRGDKAARTDVPDPRPHGNDDDEKNAALILAPFAKQQLQRLRRRLRVDYRSWMATRRLMDPDELVCTLNDGGVSGARRRVRLRV